MSSRSNFTINLTILTTSLMTAITPIQAAPAPIFKSIIQQIRNQLPRDMVMRLPAVVPNPSDPYYRGIKTYAIVRGYWDDNRGTFAVDLATRKDCDFTACNLGNIFVSRGNPINDIFAEDQRSAITVNLKPGVKGFYFYASSGSAGNRHHIFWQQNGLFFEVQSRSLSRQQVINMAKSMAQEQPIKSRKL